MNPRHPGHEHDTKPPGEPIVPAAATADEVNVGILSRFAFGLLAVVTVVCAFLIFFMKQLDKHEMAHDAPVSKLEEREPDRKAEGVRLQERPFDDVEALRTEEKRLLAEAAWVDEPLGVARIPIEDAMRIVVQRGLPTRSTVSGAASPVLSLSAAPTPAPTPRPRPRPAVRPTAAQTAPPAETAPPTPTQESAQ